MDKDFSLMHAKHNIEFLSTFYTNIKYGDWVITVSFYSAVHLINFFIYYRGVVKYRGEEYKSLDEIPKDYTSYHSIRNQVVSENFREIEFYYLKLYSASCAARYKDYNLLPREVKEALNNLKEIVRWVNKESGSNVKCNFDIRRIA